MFKRFFIAAFALLAMATATNAQTTFQTFYDLGRGHFTTTLEGFHMDDWGNTFFFIDYDYNFRHDNAVVSPNNTYFEIARCLNFWQDSKFAPFSWHLEYNGGFGTFGDLFGVAGYDYIAFPVNSAFLTGVDYFMHSSDFKNTLNLKLLYKHFVQLPSRVPLQFTAVWGCQDLFGVSNLRFSGFADLWCEYDHPVFLSEPQIWYQLFNHFNVGSEIELSYNFAGMQGFHIMPCIGTKWVF